MPMHQRHFNLLKNSKLRYVNVCDCFMKSVSIKSCAKIIETILYTVNPNYFLEKSPFTKLCLITDFKLIFYVTVLPRSFSLFPIIAKD